MFSVDDGLAIEYAAESRENLAIAETDPLAIERDGTDIDEERVDRVFRTLHTIKGASEFFDLSKIGELAHKAEKVLPLIRSGQMVPTPYSISVLLCAIDRLNELFQNPEASNRADISKLVTELAELYANTKSPVQLGVIIPDKHTQPGAGCLRTLLVEDDFACRLLMQTFLSRYGECHIAINGKEAVEAFQLGLESRTRYDLICMDILMPVMGGREAVRQIRALEEGQGIRSIYGAKIIMTTTVQEIREVFRCFGELCDAYLIKPIDLGQLLAKIKSYQLTQ
jgi:two-component system chemotaxis response regulator CheY